jgi:hypothetical protein
VRPRGVVLGVIAVEHLREEPTMVSFGARATG